MTASQVEAALDAAWPTLTTWFEGQRDKVRETAGLKQVVGDPSATSLVSGLLRNRPVDDRPELASLLGARSTSTFHSSPSFARLRFSLRVAERGPEVDVLHQIGWGSEGLRQDVEDLVEAAVAGEVGFAWHALGVEPSVLPAGDRPEIDHWEAERPTPERRLQGLAHLTASAEAGQHRALDAATLRACRHAFGNLHDHPLWVTVSGSLPDLDDDASKALRGGVVSLAPASLIPSGMAFVTAIRPLDAALLRGSELQLGWDRTAHGLELVLDQLLAVDVVHEPKAVCFRLEGS